MAADPRRVKELFAAALEVADEPARRALLENECVDDPELRQRLEALLDAHAQPQPALDQPLAVVAPCADTTTDEAQERPSMVLAGRYKLIEQIGEGGMGSVWMAQQTEPIKRTVAVKLIKSGSDSAAVLARFEAERQALALMDHPNIAKVFDAGTTDRGAPFFVMELVKGVPITQFCDGSKLTPRQRLELLVPVCQAIQHAHQKGIIHRDIKPSNVLIALYDDRPMPKVIDFGVAKAVGAPLTEQTLVTGFGAIVGTPQYMSPEQATLNNLDIDTRSDIYSLGVLLYELLAGSTPFQRKELEKAGMLEILRVIREEEPPKPSTKVSTADALPSLAASRSTEPAKLARLLRGDIDWIVMKALEKNRSRRYETAHGFAMDIKRYLADEPVLAGPPSARYRLRKFARRHRAALITTITIGLVLALAGAVVVWALGDRAAQHEAQRKEDARREAVNLRGMMVSLASAEWERNHADPIAQYKKAIVLDPNDATAHCGFGLAFMYEGRFAEAKTSTQRALDLLPELHPLRPTVLQIHDRWDLWIALEAKLPDVLAGKSKPKDGSEGLGLIEICRLQRRYAATAKLCSDAFAADTTLADDLQAATRYKAARSAVLASAGDGLDADKLDAKERTRLRQQALDWLRADLDAWAKRLADGQPESRRAIRDVLKHWRTDKKLESVLDKELQKKLPADEQDAWRKLWAEVAELAKKAADMK
jgi:serine/threonine protein kinase